MHEQYTTLNRKTQRLCRKLGIALWCYSKLMHSQHSQPVFKPLARIITSYRFTSALRRLDYLLALIAILALLQVLGSFGFFSSAFTGGKLLDQMINHSAYLSAFSLLFLPIVVGRLKDIGWSPYFSILLLTPTAFRLWLVFQLSTGGTYTAASPAWYSNYGNVTLLLVIALALVMAVWPGGNHVKNINNSVTK